MTAFTMLFITYLVVFFFFLNYLIFYLIITPYIIPKNIFIRSIFSINVISTFFDNIIINISSLVDKYIDISVPSVIILVYIN